MPKISVIIPTYNHAEFLSDAIESVLQQTYKDIEVIVVNDGSTDNTLEVLKKYQNKITLISQENQGCSSARNTGIRNSNGEYISILDSDDLYRPQKLEHQCKVLDSDNSVGIVYSDAFYFQHPSINSSVLHPCTKAPDGFSLLGSALFLDCNLPSPSTLIRRTLGEKVKWFDETMLFNEDTNFFIRASLQSRNIYHPYPGSLCRKHASNKSLNRSALYEQQFKSLTRLWENYEILRNTLGNRGLLRLRQIQTNLTRALYAEKKYSEAYQNALECLRQPGWNISRDSFFLLRKNLITAGLSYFKKPQN